MGLENVSHDYRENPAAVGCPFTPFPYDVDRTFPCPCRRMIGDLFRLRRHECDRCPFSVYRNGI